jgi:drug/metabolite transporter (DMT)-like permease
MVVFLALIASCANAVASILQRLGVEDAPAANGPSVGLVRHMIQRPVWLVGLLIMMIAYACQSVALHLGTLDVVQPLMVSELVFTVILLWLWYSTSMRVRDLLSAFATALGLGLFLGFSSGSPGTATPSEWRWFVVGIVTAGVVALFVVLGSSGPAWRRALLLGAGASVGFALLAAITKTFTNVLLGGWGAAFSSWPIYAIAFIGVCSFVIMQGAFQVGPLAASQSALILVNPIVSIIIGHTLFHETLHGGPLHVTLEVGALAMMVAGAVGLSFSALIANVHDTAPESFHLTGRGRYQRWRAARVKLP